MARWTVAWTLVFVGLVAVALAAMRQATPALASWTLWLTYVTLVAATVGAAVRGLRDGGWTGFARVGWAYFLPTFAVASDETVSAFPSSRLLKAYVLGSHEEPAPPRTFRVWRAEDSLTVNVNPQPFGAVSDTVKDFMAAVKSYNSAVLSAMKIGHILVTFVMAYLGAVLGRWLSLSRASTGM